MQTAPVSPVTVAPQRTVLTIIIAIYMMIAGILTFCGSLAIVGIGGLASNIGSITSLNTAIATAGAGSDAATTQQAQQALDAASHVGGLTVILGVILLIVGIAYLVTGIGLFMVRPWAYTAAIAISVLYIVISIIEALTAGTFGIVTLIFPILSAIILVLLLTDAGTKRAFGRA